MYRICIRAVKTRMATNKYVIGKVRVRQRVSERRDATPLVERAVYPPESKVSQYTPIDGYEVVHTK